MKDRSGESRLRQQRKGIRRRSRGLAAVDFFNALTSPELLEATETCLPAHRERLYPPTVTLSMFMKQALEADGSCQQAVDAWALQRMAEGLQVHNTDTGAYCKARMRLPVTMVRTLTRETGRQLSTLTDRWRWRGRRVRLADGTTVSMPDTRFNQRAFPQSKNQAEGVGFPLARLVGVICLSTGAVLDVAMGPLAGKGHGELNLFRGLLNSLQPQDVLLADALYCNYFEIAALQARKIDVLVKQNGSRRTDFRHGQRLGERDHRVCWPKPARPDWMSLEQYWALPDELIVREVKTGGRVLVTTLLDAQRVSKGELATLYCQRWHVELDLRNIKTTLAMDVLSCQTPAMVEKEVWVHLLAYNLIRWLMVQAAHQAGLHPRDLSFKHTLQLCSPWLLQIHAWQALPLTSQLLDLIAQRRVGTRPGRIEPRARKRRPKPYPWLKIPREQAHRQLRFHGQLLNA